MKKIVAICKVGICYGFVLFMFDNAAVFHVMHVRGSAVVSVINFGY